MKDSAIKVGTVCTLTKNDAFIFRLTGTNKQGYPMSDCIVYKFNYGKPHVQVGKPVVVAYTTLFEKAADGQEKFFNEITARM